MTEGWKRSSRCETNACVEWAIVEGLVVLRSSNKPDEAIVLTAKELDDLVSAHQAGEIVV